MNFQDIAAHFAHMESGTDSFKMLAKDSFLLMNSDPDNAGLYFVIGVAAQSYVRKYEDQGVTPEFADHAKVIMNGFNQKICQGLQSDPATRLHLLGEVAIDYEWTVRDF